MKISTWRPAIISWITDKIEVHTQELRNPEAPGLTALFLPPLRNIKHYTDEGEEVAEAIQDIYITTRYSGDLKYQELPIKTIEAVYSTLCQGLRKDYQAIAGLQDLDINPSEQPIQVAEEGETGSYGDWLITMVIYANIKWVTEIEEIPQLGFNGYQVNRISLGLYRELLDGSSKTLDATFEIPNGLVNDEGFVDEDNQEFVL